MGIIETLFPKRAIDGLIRACRAGDLEVVKYAVGRGVDVNAKNDEGHTPILAAILSGKLEVVKFLVENGVDPMPHDHVLPLYEYAKLHYMPLRQLNIRPIDNEDEKIIEFLRSALFDSF